MESISESQRTEQELEQAARGAHRLRGLDGPDGSYARLQAGDRRRGLASPTRRGRRIEQDEEEGEEGSEGEEGIEADEANEAEDGEAGKGDTESAEGETEAKEDDETTRAAVGEVRSEEIDGRGGGVRAVVEDEDSRRAEQTEDSSGLHARVGEAEEGGRPGGDAASAATGAELESVPCGSFAALESDGDVQAAATSAPPSASSASPSADIADDAATSASAHFTASSSLSSPPSSPHTSSHGSSLRQRGESEGGGRRPTVSALELTASGEPSPTISLSPGSSDPAAAAEGLAPPALRTLEGWLVKRGHVWKTWLRRWFVVRGDEVEYWTDVPSVGGKVRGRFTLSAQSRAWVVRVSGRPFAFSVTTSDLSRSFLCQAASAAELEEWVTVLNHNSAVIAARVARERADSGDVGDGKGRRGRGGGGSGGGGGVRSLRAASEGADGDD